MPEQSIRFGVADGYGSRAATWKCWTPNGKEDIYVACRELKGEIKASLHESGSWHFAYTPGFFDSSVRREDHTEKGRFIDKWQAPPHLAPGVVLALRIVTPWASVFASHPKGRGVFYAPKPADGRAIEFDVFITEPMTDVSGWPGKNMMKTALVGSYCLPSCRTVWVVYSEIPMPQLPQTKVGLKCFENRRSQDLASDSLRALVFSDGPDGSKVIYDCSVRAPTGF